MDRPPKSSPAELEHALSAVGDLLAEAGERVGIVVVGGMAMNLLGFNGTQPRRPTPHMPNDEISRLEAVMREAELL